MEQSRQQMSRVRCHESFRPCPYTACVIRVEAYSAVRRRSRSVFLETTTHSTSATSMEFLLGPLFVKRHEPFTRSIGRASYPAKRSIGRKDSSWSRMRVSETVVRVALPHASETQWQQYSFLRRVLAFGTSTVFLGNSSRMVGNGKSPTTGCVARIRGSASAASSG
jgi:hypothetical protein